MRFIKGVIQRDSGKTAEAIATFTKLTEDYPELPEPYNNLAVLYAGQNQFDKARAALEMAIRTNPSYATAHENLGDIYAKLASQAYNKALQLDTGNAVVPSKLALIREIFSKSGTKGTATASTAQPGIAASSPTAKPPALTVAPPVPPVPPVAAPQKPVAPIPTPPVVSTPTQPPVAPAATKAPLENPAPQAKDTASSAQEKEVESAVTKWAAAWAARDVKTYLAAYGKDFDPPGSMSRKAWEEERTQRIVTKSSITVKVDKLDISINGNHALAKFRQDYKAGGLVVSSRKTLDFSKVGDRWSIVKETVGN
jgi:ketosteroid isomerase-like protein